MYFVQPATVDVGPAQAEAQPRAEKASGRPLVAARFRDVPVADVGEARDRGGGVDYGIRAANTSEMTSLDSSRP